MSSGACAAHCTHTHTFIAPNARRDKNRIRTEQTPQDEALDIFKRPNYIMVLSGGREIKTHGSTKGTHSQSAANKKKNQQQNVFNIWK